MSNDGKSELFVYLGASFATLFGLFALQALYASYIDIRFHQRIAESGPSEAMVAARQEDQAQLQKGKLPLDKAIASLGQRGRTAVSGIAPNPSQDLSALSGWIYHPKFKPVTAHVNRLGQLSPESAPTPAAEPPAAAPATAAPAPAAPAATTPQHVADKPAAAGHTGHNSPKRGR